jgi:hypothetical protein
VDLATAKANGAVLFGPLARTAASVFQGDASLEGIIATWSILILLLVSSATLGLSHTALEVAIERDWSVLMDLERYGN